MKLSWIDINQPIKHTAVGGIDGNDDLVRNTRSSHGDPVGAKTIGLRLQDPADVGRGPIKLDAAVVGHQSEVEQGRGQRGWLRGDVRRVGGFLSEDVQARDNIVIGDSIGNCIVGKHGVRQDAPQLCVGAARDG